MGRRRIVGRDVASERRHWMMRIKFVGVGGFCPGLLRRKNSISVKVVRRGHSSRQRPFMLVSPMPAYEESAFRCLVCVATAHDENSNRRLAINAVIHSLQPMIEPPQLKFIEVDRGVGTKFGFASVAASAASMSPRPNDQTLQAFLVLAE